MCCKTGPVVPPFLPGDSLLFELGTLGAMVVLDIGWVTMVLVIDGIFTPFVAGVGGKMTYGKFMLYKIVGAFHGGILGVFAAYYLGIYP